MKPDQTDIPEALLEPVSLLLLDVDGVLTDGKLIYPGAAPEIKTFCVKDGLGIKMLLKAGIEVGLVTGRSSPALFRRCRELGISLVYDNIAEKSSVLEDILQKSRTSSKDNIAFMGDDLPDIPLLQQVGVPIAVADACSEVRRTAKIITAARGGEGAVREIGEALLRARGLWPAALSPYMGPQPT